MNSKKVCKKENNLYVKIVIGVLCLLLTLTLFSCSDKEKKYVYAEEGGTKAFDQVDGKPVKLSSGTKTYAIKDLPDKYRTAMKDAVVKLTATSSQITVVIDENSNSGNFYCGTYTTKTPLYECYEYKTINNKKELVPKMTKNFSAPLKPTEIASSAYYDNMKDANAFNMPWHYDSDYNKTNSITKSYIFFNTTLMDEYSSDAKLMLAMHELGHTIGLADIYTGNVYKYSESVMIYHYYKGLKVHTDYTEFDKQCIEDVYGE